VHAKKKDLFCSHLGRRARAKTLRRTRYLTSFTSTTPMPQPDPDAVMSEGAPPHFPDERTEPNWEDRPASSFAESSPEKLQPAEKSRPLPARRVVRFLFMAGIFAVGAGVGLGGAWWLNRAAPILMIRGIENVASPPVGAERRMRVGIPRGISPGELPYDGAAPPPAASASRVPAITPTRPAQEAPAPADDGAATPLDGSTEAEPPPAESVAKATGRSREDANAAAVAHKRRTPARNAKDREIDRIKRQVDEELKKKTEFGSGAVHPRSKAGPVSYRGASKVASLHPAGDRRSLLASCERAPNFFRREQCKWRVCGNSWGRNGCPSYPQPESHY
jgi:hypothetical protein